MSQLGIPQAPSRVAVIGALIVVQTLFAINYILSKEIVGVFPPLVWGSIRIWVSTIAMAAIALLSGREHPRPTRDFFLPLVGLALLGTVINQASFLTGLRLTTSTNSAVLNTLIPVFTLLIVTLRGQEPATWQRIVGFFLAFSGVLALRGVENISLTDQTLRGDLLMILNCLSYALFLAYGRDFLARNDRIWTTTWLFIYGSIGITLLAVPDYGNFQWPEMSPRLWAVAAFAVFGATLIPYFLNFWALSHARSSSVALFIYLQPPITAAILYFFYGEAVTPRTLISSFLIFLGLALGLLKTENEAVAAGAKGAR